jgi:hypothetical protein
MNAVGIGVALAVIGYVITKILDAKIEEKTDKTAPSEIQLALRKVKEMFGEKIAKNVEKIYRLETADFTSGQYQKTKGAGTEAQTEFRPPLVAPVPKVYPYGWNRKLWDSKPEYKPTGTYAMNENIRVGGMTVKGGGIVKHFIVFPSVEAGMMHLADYLNRYENDALRWYAGDPSPANDPKRKEYEQMLSKVKTQYV